jgi:lipopolysaccharide export system protein LptC
MLYLLRPWTKALALGCVLLSLLLACGSSQGTENAAVVPELKLERVRFRVWRGDALQARGDASEVTLRRDTTQVFAKDLRAELPARDGPAMVTAPIGQGLLSTKTFSAEGGVVVAHGNERATTDRARYVPGSSGDGQILGEDPVEVERGSLTLRGKGFIFDPRHGDLQVSGPVSSHAEGGGR